MLFQNERSLSEPRVIIRKDPGESLGTVYLDYGAIGGSLSARWALIAWLTNATQEIVPIAGVIACELILA